MKTLPKNKNALALIFVNTVEGRTSLYHLCEVVGVKARVFYYHMAENPKNKKSIMAQYPPLKKVHDQGLMFNNDLQLRHVDTWVLALYKDADKIEIMERG